VPSVRRSRDKRGYEHIFLVDGSKSRGAPRVLYWFRTPSGVKVGRDPFDESVRRRLEAKNPDLVFDWEAIVNAPPLPPENERWRERRKAERAIRAASREAAPSPAEDAADVTLPEEPDAETADEPVQTEAPAAIDAIQAAGQPSEPGSPAQTRRRRRRGGRRRRRPGGTGEAGQSGQDAGADVSSPSEPGTSEPINEET